MTMKRTPDWKAYFLSKVSPEPNSGCWLWTGCTEEKGYAVLYKDNWKGHRPAHRFSYETFVGPIPKGLHIDHLCNIKCCVNPAHLEPVTAQENNRRAVERRRRARALFSQSAA